MGLKTARTCMLAHISLPVVTTCTTICLRCYTSHMPAVHAGRTGLCQAASRGFMDQEQPGREHRLRRMRTWPATSSQCSPSQTAPPCPRCSRSWRGTLTEQQALTLSYCSCGAGASISNLHGLICIALNAWPLRDGSNKGQLGGAQS